MNSRRPWLTEQAYVKLSNLETQVHESMTNLGWKECVGGYDQEMRLWNFLDYLEETYVIPTYQVYRDNNNVLTVRVSSTDGGLCSTPKGVVEFWSDH